jgi:hypothetical protein
MDYIEGRRIRSGSTNFSVFIRFNTLLPPETSTTVWCGAVVNLLLDDTMHSVPFKRPMVHSYNATQYNTEDHNLMFYFVRNLYLV